MKVGSLRTRCLGVYTSPLLDTDDLKMALRARKLSGTFEKRAPGLVTADYGRHWAPGLNRVYGDFQIFWGCPLTPPEVIGPPALYHTSAKHHLYVIG